ncbi:gustatory receptor 89a [Cochliomyia hominivorax]
MSRSSCNCHWSRQVSNMRHCWNKIFFVIIRVMVVINQIIIMSPFIYNKTSKLQKETNLKRKLQSSNSSTENYPKKIMVKWKFRTHRGVTLGAIILCIFYILISPFVVKKASDIYSITRRQKDNFFITVAKFIMFNDVFCSLLIMISNISHRREIVRILNLCYELVQKFLEIEQNLVDFKLMLVLLLKMSLTTYELVLNIPYIIIIAPRISTTSVVAFVFTHYLQDLGYFFALSIFIFILLLLICSLQLEKELKYGLTICNDVKLSQLIQLQESLAALVAIFLKTFQFSIFIVILLYFVTILCNVYAMLDFYVSHHRLFGTFIAYVASLALELYFLIFISYLCERSQRRVKDLFLQREELYFLKPSKALLLVEEDLLWPQIYEFKIIGLYSLNHEFALFLFSYAVNFIVIILEFELNKKAQRLF